MRGRPLNPTAVGARVSLTFNDGQLRTTEVYCGEGYLSQSAPIVSFAVGDRVPTTLEVRWPGGEETLQTLDEDGPAVIELEAPGDPAPLN